MYRYFRFIYRDAGKSIKIWHTRVFCLVATNISKWLFFVGNRSHIMTFSNRLEYSLS